MISVLRMIYTLFFGITGTNWQPSNSTSDQHPLGKNEKVLTRTPGHPLHTDPPEEEHGGVVVDVEEGQLVGLLAYDEEKRVGELHQLGHVIPPEGTSYLNTLIPTINP